MSVKVGSARIDENGKAHGGKAGDQTGKELSAQNWYKHAKGWRVFRAKSLAVAERIAQDMQWACANSHIGYDQYQRDTLYKAAKPLGFDCKAVQTDCETDCSALVRVCCAYAGVMLPNFRTPDEPKALLDSGAFIELKGEKYTDSSAYLRRGDILVTRTQGHTVVVLSDGSKYSAAGDPARSDAAQAPGLRAGDSGKAVKELQEALLALGYALPEWGADGDFGEETEAAVRAFQRDHGLRETGEADEATLKAIDGALEAGKAPERVNVRITGGTVNVRSAPGVDGTRVLGVARKGDRLPYQGDEREVDGRPWYLVEYDGENAWVSSKYAKLVDA